MSLDRARVASRSRSAFGGPLAGEGVGVRGGLWHRSLRLALLACLVLLSACGGKDACKDLRDTHRKELLAERRSLRSTPARDQAPLHFGSALRLPLLNALLENALKVGYGDLIDVEKTLDLPASQQVKVVAKGTLTRVQLTAEASCTTCVRMKTQLVGTLNLTVPGLKEQRIPLEGPLEGVVPLILEKSRQGGGLIKVNLRDTLASNQTTLKVQLQHLPSPWSELLAGPITQALLETLAEKVGTVTLYEYDPPDVGIKGLELVPVKLEVNPKQNALFVGMSSNLPDLAAGQRALEARIDLPEGHNIAMSIHPDLLLPSLQLGMEASEIPRRYNGEGTADPSGDYHVTLRELKLLGEEKNIRRGAPFVARFKVWYLPSDGLCYWVEARAEGGLTLKNNRLGLRFEKVSLETSSLPDVALSLSNWAGAKFLEFGGDMFRTMLDPTHLSMLGSDLVLKSTRISVRPDAVILSGSASVKASGAGEAGGKEGRAP